MSVYRDNRVQIVSRSAEPDSDEEIWLTKPKNVFQLMPYPLNEPGTDSPPTPAGRRGGMQTADEGGGRREAGGIAHL